MSKPPFFSIGGLAFLFAVLFCECALADVGRTPGNFAVSSTGSATYTIPIWTPPGPNGLRPQLAVVYDSRSGGGSEGVGWSVAGLSSISLCNQTIAQDGAAAPVGMGSKRFCLDGKRLRLTSSEDLSTYGQDGTTYQTEIADFSNVTAHGTGPASFTVQGRNGWTYEYGATTDSLVTDDSGAPISWMLDKVTDRASNTMVVTWEPAASTLSGTTVPASISWTPTSHGVSQYAYRVSFNYTSLSNAAQAGYVAGVPLLNFNQLTSIEIQNTASGTASDIKAYMLDYSVSGTTGQEILSKVTECTDTSRSNCLSPTSMAYQPGQPGLVSSPTTLAGTGARSFVFDLNGDGINDYVSYSSGAVQVAFGSASGYQPPVPTPVTSQSYAIGYIDGSSQASILTAQSGSYVYYKWSGGSFVPTSTGVSVTPLGSPFSFPILADVNGDGLDDLIYSDPSGEVYVLLNTTSGGVVHFGVPIDVGSANDGILPGMNLLSVMNVLPGTRKFDFTGDGQADLLALWVVSTPTGPQYGWMGLHFVGSSFTPVGAGSFGQPGGVVDVGDYNDDGCMDVLYVSQLSLSACNGTAGAAFTFAPFLAIAGLNWDGGARRAVLFNNGGQIQAYNSLGNTLGPAIATGISYNSALSYTGIPNPTGDGLDALGAFGSTSEYYLHNGAGQPPDLLTSVTDGYSNSVQPTYVPLAQNNYSQYSDATDGYQNYIGPMYVVNQATFSYPSPLAGQTFNQQFRYSGAWVNLQGRGFSGFYAVRTYDSRTGLYAYQYHERAFPFTGMTFANNLSNGSFYPSHSVGTPIDTTTATLNATANNQRYFPYIASWTTYRSEVGGTENGQVVSATVVDSTYDQYGNLTSAETLVTDDDPGSPQYGQSWITRVTNTFDIDGAGQSADLSNWCLPLLNETQVQYISTVSGSSSVTRTKTFPSLDSGHCWYTQAVTEPGSAYQVTETLQHDAFGNVNVDTVTGVGMTPRITATNWTTASVTTGQFPMNVTDPSGAYTQSTYNDFGEPVNLIDPNNLLTNWQYDGFGRRTLETRPDGTSTSWTPTVCPTSCPDAIDLRLRVNQQVLDTGGHVLKESHFYFDQLDRLRFEEEQNLDGSFFYKAHKGYDALGNLGVNAVPAPDGSGAYHAIIFDVLNRPVLDEFYVGGSLQQYTSVAYAGDSVTVTDPQGKTTTHVTTPVGALVKSQDHDGYFQSFSYDGYGSLVGVSDSLGNTLLQASYAYGMQPYQTDLTDMDLDVSTASNQHRHYTVDALGEITGGSDANGNGFIETYDPLSRPQVRTEWKSGQSYTNPELVTNWRWGSNPANHEIGKLTNVTAGSYSEQYSFDDEARLSKRRITAGTTCDTNSYCDYDYAYNPTTGLLDHLQYPQMPTSYRFAAQYAYQYGTLTAISDYNAPSTTFWQANTANVWGEITQETLGTGSTAVVSNRSFDPATGRISSILSAVSGSSSYLQNESYLFDLVGNLTQRQNSNLGLTENFYYDDLYRLDHSTLNGTLNLQMFYDPMGNITKRSDLAGGALWTYSSSHKHQVLTAGDSSHAYTYDSNGNAVTRNGSSIAWTSYNYPSTINAPDGESVTLTYGPNRERVYQSYTSSAGTESTFYLGGLTEQVTSGTNTDFRFYVKTPDGRMVFVRDRNVNAAATDSYVLGDHQMSISSIVRSGATYVKESFTAYGDRRDAASWSGPPSGSDLNLMNGVTRQGYTGQTVLGGMGLNHMNGRVQDAVTGRFLSPDPIVQDPGFTQSYNRYSYVNNNPLTYMDPTGFDAWHCDMNSGEGQVCIPVPDVCTGSRLSCGGQEGWCSGGSSCAGFNYANGSLSDGQLTAAAGVSAAALAASGFASAASGTAASSSETGAQQPQEDSGPADITVTADRYHPDDGLLPASVVLPGVSAWTNIGNIANGLAYAALVHANPALAGRLRRERPVPGGGAVDFLLDNSLAFELKPYWWQYGPNYSSAQDQLNGYLSAGGFTAGTWADFGVGTQTVGVSGTFSGYGLTVNGTFVFGYDMQSRSSGLLFYMFSGSYSFQRGSPGGGGNMTFYP